MNIPLSKNVRGRILADDVADAKGHVIFKKGHLISKADATTIENAGVEAVHVRSPLSCKTMRGVCGQCYGMDLGKNELVALGEAVGTVAAQAIGEPGTQLTMRTFHAGGAASAGGDITQGLPRVEEIEDISKSKKAGSTEAVEYVFPFRRTVIIRAGDKVKKGDLLTDGSAHIDEVFEYGGEERAKDYVISEVGKIYELQGETVSRKHIEIIVKQMFSRRRVVEGGETSLTEGMIVDDIHLSEENANAKAAGGTAAKVEKIVMGITETSLSRKSFLSAASFQHTTRVLISNAVRGAEDDLSGLMENVIIGHLVPAGSGFTGSPKKAMIDAIAEKYKGTEFAG